MGFEEVPHTADCALRAWAPDLGRLFAEAARGMNALAGIRAGGGPRSTRRFQLQGKDPESLLVAFLSELIFLQESGVTFDEMTLSVADASMTAVLQCTRITSMTRPIKAVTFHNLNIATTRRGYEVEIVFDV